MTVPYREKSDQETCEKEPEPAGPSLEDSIAESRRWRDESMKQERRILALRQTVEALRESDDQCRAGKGAPEDVAKIINELKMVQGVLQYHNLTGSARAVDAAVAFMEKAS